MKDLIIIGAGGFGREVAWLVERINEKEPVWNILGFIDDNKDIQGSFINSYKVLGTMDAIASFPEAYYLCAVGGSRVRRKVIEKAKNTLNNIKFATVIDPSVIYSNSVEIGEGTIICAGNILTVNITIGNHVIINLDCTVGHDSILGDYDTLYPSVNVSGMSHIGQCTEIGTGAQLIQGMAVGSNSIVGAGSVVVREIPDNCTAVGCPAKPIKFFEEV